MTTADLVAAKSFRKEEERKKSVLVILYFTLSALALRFFSLVLKFSPPHFICHTKVYVHMCVCSVDFIVFVFFIFS